MKTADLPIGARVAYDVYQARDRHSFVEAYVIAHRPKGNRSSYWGERTGNNDTVAVMYQREWDLKDGTIRFEWVRPADIHYLWDEYETILTARNEREATAKAQKLAAQADRTARWNALPAAAREAVGYRGEYIVERGSMSTTLSLELIEALVAAGRASHPANVQAEVEAALKLLV